MACRGSLVSFSVFGMTKASCGDKIQTDEKYDFEVLVKRGKRADLCPGALLGRYGTGCLLVAWLRSFRLADVAFQLLTLSRMAPEDGGVGTCRRGRTEWRASVKVILACFSSLCTTSEKIKSLL